MKDFKLGDKVIVKNGDGSFWEDGTLALVVGFEDGFVVCYSLENPHKDQAFYPKDLELIPKKKKKKKKKKEPKLRKVEVFCAFSGHSSCEELIRVLTEQKINFTVSRGRGVYTDDDGTVYDEQSYTFVFICNKAGKEEIKQTFQKYFTKNSLEESILFVEAPVSGELCKLERPEKLPWEGYLADPKELLPSPRFVE